MGKLIGSVHASKLEKLTRPHYFWNGKVAKGRQVIHEKLLVRIDPSDAKYEMVDGKRRRRPDSLPEARRFVVEEKRVKRRKAA